MTRDDAMGDAELLSAMKRMWASHDPVPGDLDDGVLAVLNAQMIVSAAALTLMSDESRLVGVRSVQDARTLTLGDGDVEVVVRLIADGKGTRIDGWAVPVAQGEVSLRSDSRTRSTVVDENGRFSFTGVAAGPAELRFEPKPAGPDARPWRTPIFDIPSTEEQE